VDLYRNEFFDDVPCEGVIHEDCDPAIGDPVTVTLGGTTTGIDFALDPLGVLRGTVFDAATGAPLPGAAVRLYEPSGYLVTSVWTNGSGIYRARVVDGSFLVVAGSSGYRSELYDAVACTAETTCPLAAGSPVSVELGQTTAGIDFTLERLGAIEGTVVGTGPPLSFAEVDLYDAAGQWVVSTYVHGDGSYSLPGLYPAGYYAIASASGEYLSTIYDGLVCRYPCDVTSGTPIAVAIDTVVPGIDFELTTGGGFSGLVTEALTGLPISDARIEIYDSDGEEVTTRYGDTTGAFSVDRLAEGEYFAVASEYGFQEQLYDAIDCPGSCVPTLGTAIVVTDGQDTGGIDFALYELATLGGTVVDAATGEPLGGTEVEVFDAQTGIRHARVQTWSDGTYLSGPLWPGDYVVTAERYGYALELFDDIPCGSSCDLSLGTVLTLGFGSVAEGIDFSRAPDPRGTVEGVLTDVETGEPLEGCIVSLWMADGETRSRTVTNSLGWYKFPSVVGGSYFLTTERCDGYLDELYDDLPCLDGAPDGCNPIKGTPVEVPPGGLVRHVDFELFEMASGIAGQVTEDATGLGAAGVYVDVWGDFGQHLGTTVTRTSGAYQLRLEPGTYYLSTDSGGRFVEQIWNGLACPAGPPAQGHCDPLLGTPVTVDGALAPIVGGVDFELAAPLIFEDGFESGTLSAWSAVQGGSP